MGSRRRNGQPFALTFIEAVAMAGAALGLLLASASVRHTHIATHRCPSHEAATCIGRTVTSAVTPMAIGGFAGLFIAGSVAVGIVLAWKWAVPGRRSGP
jgi:hypothetical protein